MLHYFKDLKDGDKELMYKAPILVGILLAGADGKIHDDEIKDAIVFVEKQSLLKSHLAEYFSEVSQDLEDKFKIVIQGYPYNSTQRTAMVVEELSALNTILPKIDIEFSKDFYKALIGIAQRIASSTGGILGLNTVNDDEAKYLELYMINNPKDMMNQ